MTDTIIRPYDITDKEYVYSSWLTNYKHSSIHTKRIRNQIYFGGEHEVLDKIIARPTTYISIAGDPNLPATIYGYIVHELYKGTCPTIHFLCIKEDFRGFGIAKGLVTFTGYSLDKDIYFTHWTNPMDSLVNRKDIKLVYDPYKI